MANYDCKKCKYIELSRDHNIGYCRYWYCVIDPDNPLEDDCEGYEETTIDYDTKR